MSVTMLDLLRKAGITCKKYPGTYGVEIETESKKEYKIPTLAFWEAKGDGSLRDFGVEYVLKTPLDYKTTLQEALREFEKATKDTKFVQDSITTSVHVHINMLNETPQSFCNFLTTYTLVENMLVRYAGENRRSNGFSLPIIDAEETFITMRNMVSSIGQKNYRGLIVGADHYKYAALNLSSLSRFGSLEVRLFRGETDIGEINQWIGLLDRIVNYSRDPNRIPPDIMLRYRDVGENILGDIFGDMLRYIKHPEQKKLLDDNFWYAGNIAYATPDWKKALDEKKQAKITPKDVDKLANEVFGMPFERLNGRQQHDLVMMVRNDVGRPMAGHAEMDAAFGEAIARVQRNQRVNVRPMAEDNEFEGDF